MESHLRYLTRNSWCLIDYSAKNPQKLFLKRKQGTRKVNCGQLTCVLPQASFPLQTVPSSAAGFTHARIPNRLLQLQTTSRQFIRQHLLRRISPSWRLTSDVDDSSDDSAPHSALPQRNVERPVSCHSERHSPLRPASPAQIFLAPAKRPQLSPHPAPATFTRILRPPRHTQQQQIAVAATISRTHPASRSPTPVLSSPTNDDRRPPLNNPPRRPMSRPDDLGLSAT